VLAGTIVAADGVAFTKGTEKGVSLHVVDV
jgi:hypothetical protein